MNPQPTTNDRDSNSAAAVTVQEVGGCKQKEDLSTLTGKSHGSSSSLSSSVKKWQTHLDIVEPLFKNDIHKKWIKEEKFCYRALADKVLEPYFHIAPGLKEEAFIDVAYAKLMTPMFNDWRHRCQISMKSVYFSKWLGNGRTVCCSFLEYNYNTNFMNCLLLSCSEHKAAGTLPSNFPGVLEINSDSDSIFHEDYREFGENGYEELEFFFKQLLPKISPKRTNYKNKIEHTHRSFDEAFTESDEAFGLLVLDNELDVWNRQFEAKQNNPNAKMRGPEYQKKYVDQYKKGSTGWSIEGRLAYNMLKLKLKPLRKAKQESTNKYLTKFRDEVGAEQLSQYVHSAKRRKVQEKEANDECKKTKAVREMEMARVRSYGNEPIPPPVIDVDGHGLMGI